MWRTPWLPSTSLSACYADGLVWGQAAFGSNVNVAVRVQRSACFETNWGNGKVQFLGRNIKTEVLHLIYEDRSLCELQSPVEFEWEQTIHPPTACLIINISQTLSSLLDSVTSFLLSGLLALSWTFNNNPSITSLLQVPPAICSADL